MNDVLDELLDRAEQVPVGTDPATEEDLIAVEEQIFLPLPRDYRDFLRFASHLVIGRLEPCNASDPSSYTYLPEVCANAWDAGLDRHLFPICEDQGSYYCMNPEGEVSFWDGAVYSETTWDGIWEWAADIWLHS